MFRSKVFAIPVFVPVIVSLLATTFISQNADARNVNWDAFGDLALMHENNNTQPTPGEGVTNCLRPASDYPWHTVRTDASGNLARECQPDTLYTWLPYSQLKRYEGLFGNRRSWPSTVPTVYASKGPIATFGYGPVSIRFKLRDGVRFKFAPVISESCDEIPQSEKDNTVFVRSDAVDLYADYAFCSPKVLHSWSYGTVGHYDELVRDLRVLRSLYSRGIDLRGKMELYSGFQGADIFRQSNLDPGVDFSFDNLVSNFQSMANLTSQGGRLFINPSLRIDTNTAADQHFRSRTNMYFMRK